MSGDTTPTASLVGADHPATWIQPSSIYTSDRSSMLSSPLVHPMASSQRCCCDPAYAAPWQLQFTSKATWTGPSWIGTWDRSRILSSPLVHPVSDSRPLQMTEHIPIFLVAAGQPLSNIGSAKQAAHLGQVQDAQLAVGAPHAQRPALQVRMQNPGSCRTPQRQSRNRQGMMAPGTGPGCSAPRWCTPRQAAALRAPAPASRSRPSLRRLQEVQVDSADASTCQAQMQGCTTSMRSQYAGSCNGCTRGAILWHRRRAVLCQGQSMQSAAIRTQLDIPETALAASKYTCRVHAGASWCHLTGHSAGSHLTPQAQLEPGWLHGRQILCRGSPPGACTARPGCALAQGHDDRGTLRAQLEACWLHSHQCLGTAFPGPVQELLDVICTATWVCSWEAAGCRAASCSDAGSHTGTVPSTSHTQPVPGRFTPGECPVHLTPSPCHELHTGTVPCTSHTQPVP